jgi:hypothetical protein
LRRRLLLLATLVALAVALAIGVEAALAGNPAPQQATLTVTEVGTGTGLVTSDPVGISCGAVCSARFAIGTIVKLGGQAAGGSEFEGLAGQGVTASCVGGKNLPGRHCSYTVTLDGDTSVQATFNLLPPCVVPKVKGWILYVAKRRLRSENCRVGAIRRAFSRKVEKTVVISQSPRAGQQLANEAKVNLVVSKGRR